MVIKRIIRKNDKGHRSCLRCGRIIEGALWDDEVYICWYCGQQHFVDIYKNTIEITVVERPDVRHRPQRGGAHRKNNRKSAESPGSPYCESREKTLGRGRMDRKLPGLAGRAGCYARSEVEE